MQKFLRIMMLAALMLPFASQAQSDCSTPQTIPYEENFDAYSGNATGTSAPSGYPDITLPSCWDFINMSTGTYTYPQAFLSSSSAYAVSGNCLFFKSSNATKLYAVMPAVASDLNTLQVRFTYRNEGTTTYNGLIVVGYMTDATDATTFVALDTCVRTTTKTEHEVLFPASVPTGARAAFCYVGGTSSNYYASIDNVFLESQPSCKKVGNVNVVATSSTLTLKWLDTVNTGATYSIMRTTGTGDEAETAWFTAAAGDTAYAFTGLAANTNYTFALRALCSATDSSRENTLSTRTLNDADTIRTFTASGTTKRGDLVFDTAARTITIPVWYTNSLSSGFTLSWNLASNAAAFIDTTGDGSYTCQVTAYSVKNYLRMNTPLTLRIKAEDRALYTDYTLLLQSEDCVKDRNFALSAERIRYTATWDNPDTLVTTHYFIHSATQLSAEDLETAEYITVTGAHQYTVEGLERGTQYYAYLKAACDTVWAEDSVTTKNLGACEDIVIADGTGTNAYVPLHGNYAERHQRIQSIYPASMLTEMVGVTLDSIHYFVSSGSSTNWGSQTWEISLGITEMENLSNGWVDTLSLTRVYTGTLSANSTDGMSISFDQPFTYNGGNLVVQFVQRVPNSYTSCYFRGVSSGVTGASRYAYPANSDDLWEAAGSTANFLPKFSFEYCAPVNACPEVTAFGLDSLSHDFARISWTAADADYCVGNQIIVSATMLDSAALEAATPVALAATATSYDASGLIPDHDYYVYIKALCNGTEHPEGTSGWAAYEFHTYPTVRTPEIVAADFTGKHKATLYVANTGANVGQPVNYDYIASTTLLDAAALAAATPTATGIDTMIFDVENLASATQYFFYVRNVMGTDVSPWSAPDSVTMPVAMPKPLHLQASNVAHNALTALWVRDDANYADETAWRAAIVLHGQQPAAADWLTTTDMEESSVVLGYHVFIGLTTDTAYDIYVAAYDQATGATSDTVVLDSVRTAKFPGNGIIVADSTATNSNVMLRSLYQDTDHRSQVIYPADKMFTLQGKSLTAMTFFTTYTSSIRDNYGDWTENNFVLRLAVTPNESLASAWDATVGDTVFNGSISTVEDGKLVFDFDTPFQYNGGNLLVELLYDDSFGNRYTAGNFYGMTVENASRYANGSTALTTATGTVQNFLPKVMFDYEGESTCLPVTTLYVEDLTYQSADLLWYPGNEETSWQYVVSTSDSLTAAELEAAAQPVQSNNIALTGLMNDTAYTFYIRPVCSENENGSWNNFGFETQHADFYDVTVVVNDETMGTAAGLTGILAGTDTTIVAVANEGYEFYKWVVDSLESYSDTLFLSVDSNITVNAYFKPAEATIAASAVTYWVGTGSNEAVLAVNWADTALAWGVRFSTETITVQAAMDSIAANDPRFSYTLAEGYLDDILFAENGDTLSKVMDSYWESKNNGETDWGLFQPLANGDFEKWAEPAAGVVYDSTFWEDENPEWSMWYYLYAYPMAINPVTAPAFYTVTVTVNDVMMGDVTGAPEAPVFAGTEITLTAEAEDYAHFVCWTYGNNVDSNETLTVTVNSDLTINAIFAYNPVHVTYAVNDTAMGSITPSGVQTYEVGDIMVVTATANEGYHLAGWRLQVDGEDSTATGLGATLTDTVTPFHDGAILTALFEADPVVETYTVTVIYDTTMGTISGIPAEAVEAGTTVTLAAVASDGYHFVSWMNAAGQVITTNPYTFTVTENVSLSATFEANDPVVTYYNVAVSSSNTTMGTVTATASGQVAENTQVTATASANSGYHFVAWVNANNDTVARTNVYNFTVTADVTLIAVFAENNPDVNYYTVTVTYDQSRGRVEGAAEYEEGSTVSLVAYPFEHYEFVAWLGENNDTLSTNTAYTISNLQSNRSLTAIFQPKTGIEDVEGVSATIFSVDNRIVVKGAENMNVYVYDVNGRAVSKQNNATETVEFTMQNTGVYLVKVGNAPAKRVVVVR